jgi:CheY-like chemotaxis protein
MLLRMSGHQVRTAHTGPSAIEIALDFRPNVVLLDIGLPGMDGFEIARRLRGMPELKDMCLIACTGYGGDDHRRLMTEAGFDGYLIKPVEVAELERILLH